MCTNKILQFIVIILPILKWLASDDIVYYAWAPHQPESIQTWLAMATNWRWEDEQKKTERSSSWEVHYKLIQNTSCGG